MAIATPNLRLPCQPQRVTAHRPVPNYDCFMTGTKQLARSRYAAALRLGVESATWSQVIRRPTRCATTPPTTLLLNMQYFVKFILVNLLLLLHRVSKNGHCFIFSERELLFTFAIRYRPSVYLSSACLSVCLSPVTLVRPTQAVEIFGNISTAFGTLAIRW